MAATDDQKRNRFVSSTLAWMSANDPKTGTVDDIVARLQEISDTVPLRPPANSNSTTSSAAPEALGAVPEVPITASNDPPAALVNNTPGICGPLRWRIENVTDFRGKVILPAGERLMRWEISSHEEIFTNGIISLAERKARKDPTLAISSINDLKGKVADLRNYVRNFGTSVFVSTSRTWTDSRTGEIKRIVPDPEQVKNRHEYEIFAHGGIDVTESGESGHNFTTEDEREISVAGGVRREFIRSVRTYPKDKGIEGDPVVWENPYFNPSANGQGVSVKLADLPAIVDLASGVEVKTWIPPPPEFTKNAPIEHAKDESPENVPPPAMIWTAMGDKTASLGHVPMTRASFTKSDGSQIWFANNCLMVLKDEKEKPSPMSIAVYWPGVLQAGITRIDAILSTAGLSAKHQLFIFGGEDCAQIEEASGNVVNGPPRKIREVWPALDQAGFSEIDAVLPYPAPNETVAFFRKTRYALVKFNAEKGSAYSELIGSGEYAAHWPALEEFDFLDAALVDPEDDKKVHFTCGDRFIYAEAAPDELEEEIEEEMEEEMEGPELFEGKVAASHAQAMKSRESRYANRVYEDDDGGVVSRGGSGVPRGGSGYDHQQKIADKWTALKSAGFY
ncbi:hypothetical protein BDV93DRAFT_237782 [Ceratobasidium sp. AG-I]|nr:hypothetical protein BDV93DRAFT_237782 [Ceratobasidium sp. AG-I]